MKRKLFTLFLSILIVLSLSSSALVLSFGEETDTSETIEVLDGPVQKADSKGNLHWYYYKDNQALTGTKWIKDNNVDTYYLRKGELVTGWLSYQNKAYCFDNQAKRIFDDKDPISGIKIGSKGYISGDLGKAYSYAIKRMDKYGWSLKMALKAARRIPFHDKTYKPSSIVEGALYAIKYKCGNCYVRHCVFALEAKLLGYKYRLIKGTVGASKAPHSWVEAKLDGKWWVFDATTYKPWTKGYKIYYGKKGTYKYNRVSSYLKFK